MSEKLSIDEMVKELDTLRYQDAEGARRRAKKYIKLEPESPKLLAVMGSILRMVGKLQEALDALDKAMALATEQDDGYLLASVYQRLAYTWIDYGRPDVAEGFCREGINLYAELGDLDGVGQCLYDRGVTFYFREAFARTLKLNMSALKFLSEENTVNRFAVFVSSATCAAKLGDVDSAKTFVKRAEPFTGMIPGFEIRTSEAWATIAESESLFRQAGEMRSKIAETFMEASKWLDAAMSLMWSLEDYLQASDNLAAAGTAKVILPTLIGQLGGGDGIQGSILMEIWRAAMYSDQDLSLDLVRKAKKELQGTWSPEAKGNG